MKEKSFLHGVELVAVSKPSLLEAQSRITACEVCSGSASLPFGALLDEVIDRKDAVAYLLYATAHCPKCENPITETTLIHFDGEPAAGDVVGYFEPSWEETNLVFVDEDLLLEAQQWISGCENCVDNAEITFDYLLDTVTGCDPTVTEYLMCRPAKCSRCYHEVAEKTLVTAH